MSDTATIATGRRFRRFSLRAPRFGLRVLLAGVTICAAACGWFAHHQRQVEARRTALSAVYAAEGFASFEHQPCPRRDGRCGSFLPQAPPGPAWLRSVLGNDFFARVGCIRLYECRGVDDLARNWDSFRDIYTLDLGNSDITDRGLMLLPPLPRLIHLRLDGTSISDAGLPRLRDFRQLTWLDLGQTKVSAAGLDCLRGLTELGILNLAGTQVTSAGMAPLCELPSLGNLNLSHTAIDDEGLALVGRITGLLYLDLSSTKVTDRGLRHIARLTQLIELNLSDSAVTGSGLAELGALCNLEELNLSPSDDGALAALNSLPMLERLTLSGPGVTDTSLAYVLRFGTLKSLTLERTQVSWFGLALGLACGPEDFRFEEPIALIELLESPLLTGFFGAMETLLAGGASESPEADATFHSQAW